MRQPASARPLLPDATEGSGERIRAARKARDMTQDDLARAVGVSRSAVAQWETDRSGQVGSNLARVAQILGVPAEHLLTGAIPPADSPAAAHGTEWALLKLYRLCTDEDRALLLRTARRLARQAEHDSD